MSPLAPNRPSRTSVPMRSAIIWQPVSPSGKSVRKRSTALIMTIATFVQRGSVAARIASSIWESVGIWPYSVQSCRGLKPVIVTDISRDRVRGGCTVCENLPRPRRPSSHVDRDSLPCRWKIALSVCVAVAQSYSDGAAVGRPVDSRFSGPPKRLIIHHQMADLFPVRTLHLNLVGIVSEWRKRGVNGRDVPSIR